MTGKELINEIESKIAWNDMNINETSISLRDVKRLLNELEEQAERVQELENHLKLYDFWNRLAYEQNKRYREALEFYADKENYKLAHFDPNLDDYMSTVDYDEGMKARKALEGGSK